jgi:two-component system cell cycle response regulator
MSAVIRIALVGFTSFEYDNFDSYFRLAERPVQPFVLTARIAECRLAVVNADDDAAVAEVTRQDKLSSSLMLGNKLREGAAMQLTRPINLTLVVRALEELAQHEPPASRAVQRVLDDLAQVTATLSGHINPREMAAAWAEGDSHMGPTRPQPRQPGHSHSSATRERRSGLDHILVVDEHDSAMRFIVNQLERFGFQLHLARSADEALDRIARRHFELVFVDVSLADARGRNTCAAIRQLAARRETPPPTVVVMADEDTPVAQLPEEGCDAYLLRPLAADALLKVVGDREVAKHAFARTAHTAGTLI